MRLLIIFILICCTCISVAQAAGAEGPPVGGQIPQEPAGGASSPLPPGGPPADGRSSGRQIKANLIAAAGTSGPKAVFSLAEPVAGGFRSAGAYAMAGFVPLSEKQVLSVSISKTDWEIVKIKTGEFTVTSSGEAIIVTNDGNTKQAFGLAITGASNWNSSDAPGEETFSLKGLFCAPSEAPVESDFSNEDTITALFKKATDTVFAYPGSTQNGGLVKVKDRRALFLKFESPTKTKHTEEQQIQVTVTAQLP